MNDKAKISVIISVYNSEKFIKGRLDNLIEQTVFHNIEIIIINSASQQNEEAIIRDYLSKYNNIKYLRTVERETIYKAWNRAIRMSSGEYITNANADDRLRKDALEILSDALDKNPQIAIVYAEQYITNIPNADFGKIDKKKKFDRLSFSKLRQLSGYIAGPQSMWRGSLHLRDNIWFDEKYEVSGDNDFVCRVAEKYELLRVPEVLGIYFKAKNDSNKEFRNYNETHNESLEVKEKYLRRYLSTLSFKKKIILKTKITLYKTAPHNLIRIIRKIISRIKPESQIPSREYMFLISSILEEIEGNKQKALKICLTYKEKASEELIKRQINHLQKNINP